MRKQINNLFSTKEAEIQDRMPSLESSQDLIARAKALERIWGNQHHLENVQDKWNIIEPIVLSMLFKIFVLFLDFLFNKFFLKNTFWN